MAGYSNAPLQKKLGIRPDSVVLVKNPPENYFEWIAPLPATVKVQSRFSGNADFIHVFVTRELQFQELFLMAKKHLKKDGMLWISWPKRSSKRPTDLNENIIRKFGLEAGLVDVKVCAIDETWSGLKFVFRLKDR